MSYTKGINWIFCIEKIKKQVFLKEKNNKDYFISHSDWKGVLDNTDLTFIWKLSILF